jgi:hypothetical protein
MVSIGEVYTVNASRESIGHAGRCRCILDIAVHEFRRAAA